MTIVRKKLWRVNGLNTTVQDEFGTVPKFEPCTIRLKCL